MAYRIQGIVRLDNSGNANLGVATATEFDGKVSDKAITEQTDGTSTDVTGADELLLYDTNTGDLLRVTVDEFIAGAGIAPVGIVTSDTFVSVGASLIPTTNITYDLGSASNRFRDLYLDGNTIYLGEANISIAGGNLTYEGEQVITGVGGTISTDYANITGVNAGIITATQIGSPNADTLELDGNLIPIVNKEQDLGHALKSWNKVFIRTGPKGIEFENSGVGIGFTVNGVGDNILEFDGHELFAGDGDIGHHGNLNNIYASGIISASSGAVIGGVSTFTDHVTINDSNNLGTEYNFNVKTSGSSTFGVLGNGAVLLGNSSASPFIASNDHHATSKKYVDDAVALRALLDGTNIPGPFNNDTSAATGGVPVGGIYKNSNGTIHWRTT